jgi:predicted nucleotidyltransferase
LKLEKSKLPLYTPERRQKILDYLVSNFEKDERIAGVILVGSAAFGFIDDLSDIDLAIVTFPEHDVLSILKDWKEKVPELLDIIECFEVHYNPEILLLGFLTEDFLEMNIGFQNTENIFARRKHWKIAFDKIGTLQQLMEDTWKKEQSKNLEPKLKYHVSGSWHYVVCICIALSRGNYWRALNDIDYLKKELLDIIAIRYGIKVNYFLDSEHMSRELRSKMKELLITKLDKREIFNVIQKLVALFYEEANKTAKHLGNLNFYYLSKRMTDYLVIMEKRLFNTNIK